MIIISNTMTKSALMKGALMNGALIKGALMNGALMNGAVFSIFSGLCEYYLSRKTVSSYVLWVRITSNTAIGFLYGAGFTYYWRMPVLINLFNFINGFYGGKERI
jgi:hypothetical protein